MIRPSARTLSTIAVITAAFLMALRTIHSFDVFWYLRAGSEILTRHALPLHDPFSFTSDKDWLNHEWLSEIVLSLTHRAGGFGALILLQSLCVATAMVLLLPPRTRSSILFPVALSIAAFILGEAVEPRAQLFSWVLFSATLRLALNDYDSPSPRLYLTWPLGLLWANLHGGDPTGVAVLGLLFLASPSVRRALACAGAALLTCANPYGLRVHGHFLGAHNNLVEIREWAPLGPSLQSGSLPHWLFVALAIFAAISLALRARRQDKILFEALLLLVFTALAARYVRFSTQGALLAAVVLARQSPTTDPTTDPTTEQATPRRKLIAIATALSLLLVCQAGSRRGFGFGLAENRFPTGAVDWLKAHHPQGPMFNSYNYGGYLIWAYPEEKVFIDGRAFTVYSNDLFQAFLNVYDDPPAFRRLESRYGLKLAVVQRAGRGAAFLDWLRAQPDWHIDYEDSLAAIATKRP